MLSSLINQQQLQSIYKYLIYLFQVFIFTHASQTDSMVHLVQHKIECHLTVNWKDSMYVTGTASPTLVPASLPIIGSTQ